MPSQLLASSLGFLIPKLKEVDPQRSLQFDIGHFQSIILDRYLGQTCWWIQSSRLAYRQLHTWIFCRAGPKALFGLVFHLLGTLYSKHYSNQTFVLFQFDHLWYFTSSQYVLLSELLPSQVLLHGCFVVHHNYRFRSFLPLSIYSYFQD